MGEFERTGQALWGVVAFVSLLAGVTVWFDVNPGEALLWLLPVAGGGVLGASMLWALIAPAIRWWREWH